MKPFKFRNGFDIVGEERFALVHSCNRVASCAALSGRVHGKLIVQMARWRSFVTASQMTV